MVCARGQYAANPGMASSPPANFSLKGDENGIDCAHYYHYFTRGGLSQVAS
jgi:hypothetical protein